MAPHHHRTGNGHSSVQHHFFRFILQHTLQIGKLKLPLEFARVYGKALSGPVFLNVPDNEVWKLELTKCDGRLWLQKGWQKFAEHYSLEHGHSLVFRYEGNSHFHVVIFNKSATDPCFDNSKETQQQEVNIEESEDEPTEIMGDIASQKRKKPELQCSRPNKMMRSNPCDKAETSLKFESVATRLGHDNEFSAGKGEADCRVKGLRTDEKRKALQRVCSSFKTDNPNFLAVMQPAYVGLSSSHSFCLCVPIEFSRKYLMDHGDVILCNSSGNTWTVEYYSILGINKKLYVRFCKGWGDFAQDNNILVGDVCAFELIKCNEITFKVFIYRSKEAIADVNCRPTADANSQPSQGVSQDPLGLTPQSPKAAREKAPFFSRVVLPTHLKENRVDIPFKFIEQYFEPNIQKLILKVGNRSWPVKITTNPRSRMAKLTSGWTEFARENFLKVGDICVYEVDTVSNDLLKVSISGHRH